MDFRSLTSAPAGMLHGDFSTLNVDFANPNPVDERAVSNSVTQELDYLEKVVFSFDMERDPTTPSEDSKSGGTRRGPQSRGEPATPRANSREYFDQIDPQLLGALYASSANRANQQHQPQSAPPAMPPPGMAPLDPYMIAHAAALSALAASPQQPLPFPGQHGAPDPYAFFRAMYGQSQPVPPGPRPGPSSSSSQPLPPPALPPWLAHVGQPIAPQASSSSSRARAQTHTSPSPAISPSASGSRSQQPEAGPSQPRGRSQSMNAPAFIREPSEDLDLANLDEASMTEEKRRRNTLASARFRIKKKHKSIALDRTVTELEGRADVLEREAVELRRENGFLKELLVLKGRNIRAARETAETLKEGGEMGPGDKDEDEDEEEEEGDTGEAPTKGS